MSEERFRLSAAIVDHIDPSPIDREAERIRRTRAQAREWAERRRAAEAARCNRKRSKATGRGWRPVDGPKPRSVRGCDGRYYAPYVMLYDERMGEFWVGYWSESEGRWEPWFAEMGAPDPTHWSPIPTPPGGWPFGASSGPADPSD